MAINIFSKNILNIDNQTTKDNVINKVTINSTKVEPLSEYKTNVFSQFFVAGDANYTEIIDENYFVKSEDFMYGDYNELAYVYADIKPTYLKISRVTIQKLLENKYISKIYTGVDLNGNNNINYSVYFRKELENVNGTYDTNLKKLIVGERYNTIGLEENVGSLPKSIDVTESYTNDGYDGTITANAEINDLTNLNKIEFVNLGNDFYTIPDDKDIMVLYSIKTNTFHGRTTLRGIVNAENGIQTYYAPQKIELNINGDVIGIDLKQITQEYGSGNKPFAIENNELIQTTNEFINDNANKQIADIILNAYKNGKETAVIECNFADYYDESGEKVIDLSGAKMAFDIGDRVIPHIPNSKNEDVPMSLYKDKTPKQFTVIGVKPSCKGVPRQTLTLLEV